MASNYEANKRWRRNNPKARAAQTMRNYKEGKPTCAKRRRVWTSEEDILITTPNRAEDRYLARTLNCSVQAIQARRCKLLKISRATKTHTPGD